MTSHLSRRRKLLLDLFCGAGGAAVGYHQAGFEVVGVDLVDQPRYPFAFVQADAIEYLINHGHLFDVIHASPPCQAWSTATPNDCKDSHPQLIAKTREILQALARPYVIENVRGAYSQLRQPIMLCGSMVDLPIQRHRFFEISPAPSVKLPLCKHHKTDLQFDHGLHESEAEYRDAMECNWMTTLEAREAIPPAYTEFIATLLFRSLN